MKYISYFLFAIATMVLSLPFFSCANRGVGPQGGPKDTIPPIILKTTPENGALNFNKQKIEIELNEIVVLEKIHEKAVVSPPQKNNATIKAYGKKVIVQLNDTIKPGTTYVIDFADAIVDNNEKNPLKNYTFKFSSGPIIDTLRMSGYVIDAETLNPCAGILVGAHTDLSDSAFTSKPLDVIAKTDEHGYFCIKNVKEGARYRLYALKDINNNYHFDMKEEMIAFKDTVFSPVFWTEERNDTLMADSLTIDSIYSYRVPIFRPNDVILKLFKEYSPFQKFIKAERRLPYRFDLFFNAPLDSLPKIRSLNFDLSNHIVQKSEKMDTLTFWLTDSIAWQTDTLMFELYHPKTDSVGAIQIEMDTLKLVVKKDFQQPKEQPQKSRRGKTEKDDTPKVEFLNLKCNLNSYFDVYRPITLSFETPIQLFDSSKVHLEIKKDTIWESIPIDIVPDGLGLSYTIEHEWIPEKEYRFKVDSAAFYEYYGKHTNNFDMTFRTRSLEEYSNLFVVLKYFTGKEHLILLNTKEEIVREQKADVETVFEYLEPGEYYLKLFIDENQNGEWDTGEYAIGKQAETVCFYPSKIVLRAFWDVEEEWNYTTIPLLKQKPLTLIKDSKQ